MNSNIWKLQEMTLTKLKKLTLTKISRECIDYIKMYTVIPRKLAVPNSRNSVTRGSARYSLPPNSRYLLLYKVAPKFAIPGHFLSPKNREFGGIAVSLKLLTEN